MKQESPNPSLGAGDRASVHPLRTPANSPYRSGFGFRSTVEALIPEWPNIESSQRVTVATRCADLLRQQLSLAPVHIRFGFWVLFVAYRCYLLLRAGLTPSTRARSDALTAFSALPFPMVFGLERLLRSATVLFYFEQPEILMSLGEETIEMRQATFRAKRKQKQLQ